MITRRRFLAATGIAALAPLSCRRRGAAPLAADPNLLNDVHSQLNPTRVARVAATPDLAALQRVVRETGERGAAISIGGGRHSMGGQQFGTGTVHLDTRPLDRVLGFDPERGTIEVEAGIQWPELVEATLELQRPGQRRGGAEPRWGIAQKQTGADRMCLGGSVSANAHGRGLTLAPLVGEVEALELVDARGELRRLDRRQEPELFALAVGGYGLFGVIYSVTLRLVERRKLQRVVEIRGAEELDRAFAERIAAGFLYGDLQFEVDARSSGFLRRGVFSCYRPADHDRPIPDRQLRLRRRDWIELLRLAHTDKSQAFRIYSRYYLSTDGQLYWSDTQQLAYYADDYHRDLDRRLGGDVPGSEMITELYVPRAELAGFLGDAAELLRSEAADVVYGTVRLIERDPVSVLAWAREPWACTVLNLHVDHDEAGRERAARTFRHLIDVARRRGGSYFLTYHRWADREQVEACHPRMVEFLRAKLAHDPDERFQSDWYRHYRTMFADRL